MASELGQHWLLLRGLSREAAHWGEFLPRLQSEFPTAKMYTLDLPGTGARHQENSPLRISAIMEAVREEAKKLQLLERPLTIVGLSLGGMVAWEWISKHPDEICAGILINSSMANLSPFYQRLRWQSYANFFKLIVQPDRYRRELTIIRCVANSREHEEETAKTWASIQVKRPVRVCNTLRQLYAAAHYRPSNEKPGKPILLINARGDRLVAPDCSEAIQAEWKLPLKTHPWGGHDLPLDDGDWIAKTLKQWLTEIANNV